MARRCVWSWNLENEEAKARYRAVKILPKWVVTPGKQTNNNVVPLSIHEFRKNWYSVDVNSILFCIFYISRQIWIKFHKEDVKKMHWVTANFVKFGEVKDVLIRGGVNGFVSKFRKFIVRFWWQSLVYVIFNWCCATRFEFSWKSTQRRPFLTCLVMGVNGTTFVRLCAYRGAVMTSIRSYIMRTASSISQFAPVLNASIVLSLWILQMVCMTDQLLCGEIAYLMEMHLTPQLAFRSFFCRSLGCSVAKCSLIYSFVTNKKRKEWIIERRTGEK